jgi:hypothetical protein
MTAGGWRRLPDTIRPLEANDDPQPARATRPRFVVRSVRNNPGLT